MTWSPGATLPVPNGVWYCAVPEVSQTDVRIDSSSEYTDLYGGTALNLAAQVNYVEYYYATDFSLPPPSAGLSPFLTAVPGVSVTALPLWIRDNYNKCSSSTVLPAEGISLNAAKVYIDGDGGVGTGLPRALGRTMTEPTAQTRFIKYRIAFLPAPRCSLSLHCVRKPRSNGSPSSSLRCERSRKSTCDPFGAGAAGCSRSGAIRVRLDLQSGIADLSS